MQSGVQDFATGKNFSFNQCHITKRFAFFFSGKLSLIYIKAVENFSPVFA